MSKNFSEAIEARRSYYGISKESPISNEKIQAIIEHAVKHTPSPFNSQSARVILLFGDHHNKLWDITLDALKAIVPAEAFDSTKERIDSFKAGYGTVLYFENLAVTEGLQEQFPLYKDNFPVWGQQSNGMLQFAIWNSLELEGLGASLQHYSPLIDDGVRNEWHVDGKWKLIAQMPFGKPVAEPGVKEFLPIDQRVSVFK